MTSQQQETYEKMHIFLEKACEENPVIRRDITFIFRALNSRRFGFPIGYILSPYEQTTLIANLVYEKYYRNKEFENQH